MTKTTLTIFAISVLTFAACNNNTNANVPDENYTVVKENGEQKTVTTDADEAVIQSTNLPPNAQTFIKQNFGSETIQNVLKETDHRGDEYKVQLGNGIKIEFDANGEWKEVKAGVANQSVGALFLPQVTRDYLSKYYPNIGIESVDRDAQGIDIDLLQNNVDLKFDSNGNFLRID